MRTIYRVQLARRACRRDCGIARPADLHAAPYEPTFAAMSVEEAIEMLVRRVVREELIVFARQFAKQEASQRYVTIQQYAHARSISVSTVRNAIRSGKLPAMRVGSAVRVPDDVEIGVAVHPDAKPDTTRDYTPSEIADLIIHKVPRKQWSEYPPGFVARLLGLEQASIRPPG